MQADATLGMASAVRPHMDLDLRAGFNETLKRKPCTGIRRVSAWVPLRHSCWMFMRPPIIPSTFWKARRGDPPLVPGIDLAHVMAACLNAEHAGLHTVSDR
jgi:hypothetical protein